MARDRDNEFYDYVAPTRSDSAIDAAERARISTMARANAAARPETFLEQVESQIAKTRGRISDLEKTQAEADASNPSGMTKDKNETNSAFNARVKAAEAAARANAAKENPLLNKAVKPTNAPPGQYYAWIGGTNTGQWQLYTIPTGGTGGVGGVGGVGGTLTTTTTAVTEVSETTRDAFEALKLLFDQYGLGSLADKINGYMKDGIGPNQAALLLKQSDEYKKRFAGNQKRLTMGLNVVSEAEYLDLENAYGNTLRAYGLGNMLSLDRNKNQEMFANYIGNDIGATEFKDRVQLATGRVINADPSVKELFKKWYPSLTDGDLASYFLNPSENLPKLQEKATTAEIGAAALGQGLTTSLQSATDLAKFGVDRSTALKGYATIGEVLPTATKLGDIYNESRVKYTQTEGEAEVFKGSSSASNKRNRLASLERGSFSASSGNAPTGKSSAAGQI